MRTPGLVERALAGAGPAAFPVSLGPLLHVLAGRRGLARPAVVEEPGSCLRAAWVASALPPGVPLLVASPGDAHALEPLRGDPDVRVVTGGAEALAPEAPFDLLAAPGTCDAGVLAGLLAPGGTLVLDGAGALARVEESGLLAGVEVRTTDGTPVVLALLAP